MKKLLLIAFISSSLFLNAQIAPYCVNTFTDGVEPITKVVFAGINNTSPATLQPGTSLLAHQDFTTIVANVIAGNTYQITLKGNTGGNFNNNFSVFCDWNSDNDFLDAGETFNIGSIVSSTGIEVTGKELFGSIPVPVNVTAGTKRMRVLKSYNATPSVFDLSCRAGAGYGQSEDYSISVTVPSCFAPTNGLSVVNVPLLSADLSWTPTGALNHEILVLLASLPAPANTANIGTNVAGTTFTATGSLLADTNYKFYVRSECVDGVDYSTWAGPFLFNTYVPTTCNTIITPANGATGVPCRGVVTDLPIPATFSWDAAPNAVSYNFYYGNSPTTTTAPILLGNYTTTTTTIVLTGYNAVFYWRIVPVGLGGPAVGCSTVSSFTTQLAPLATSDFSLNNNLKIFPNPVKDILSLTYDKSITNISIYNLLGQEVLKQDFNTNEPKIDMTNLASGAYMVKITSDSEVKTIKVIKE